MNRNSRQTRASARKGTGNNGQPTIKDSLFPISLFAIFLGVLFLMSGIHVGLVVLMNRLTWNELVQTIVTMVYWGCVAVGLTLFTRRKIKSTYEETLHRRAETTAQVVNGDLSGYVPTRPTSEGLE